MNTPSISNNQIGSSMLPFVMSELTSLVMKKKALAFDDALHYIYSSRLYRSLLDENTKQWYSSTLLLFEELEREKTEEKRKQNDEKKILLFKVFCIENFREFKRWEQKKPCCYFLSTRFSISLKIHSKCYTPKIQNT